MAPAATGRGPQLVAGDRVGTIDLGLKAQTDLRMAVLRKLDAAGIAIPYPQRDVHLRAAAEALQRVS
jgi:small-conductance mechanosensitive channel